MTNTHQRKALIQRIQGQLHRVPPQTASKLGHLAQLTALAQTDNELAIYQQVFDHLSTPTLSAIQA